MRTYHHQQQHHCRADDPDCRGREKDMLDTSISVNTWMRECKQVDIINTFWEKLPKSSWLKVICEPV